MASDCLAAVWGITFFPEKQSRAVPRFMGLRGEVFFLRYGAFLFSVEHRLTVSRKD
jgi:hypothetical protein